MVDNHVLNFARQRVFPDEDVPLSALQFLGVTALGFFPWALACRWRWPGSSSDPWKTPEARVWMLFALWTVGILGVFALSPFKLPHYGLPAFPAMALLVARLWDDAIERPAGAPRSFSLLAPRCSRPPSLGPRRSAPGSGGCASPRKRSRCRRLRAELAAQGQAATSDFLAQFRPLFGPIAGIFLLRRPRWRWRPGAGFRVLGRAPCWPP